MVKKNNANFLTSEEQNRYYEDYQREIICAFLGYVPEDDTDRYSNDLSLLEPNDFSDPALRTVFESIANVSSNGANSFTKAELIKDLTERGVLASIGGTNFIFDLYADATKSINIAKPNVFARAIKNYAVKHTIVDDLTAAIPDFYEDSGKDTNDAIANLQNKINDQVKRLDFGISGFDIATSVDAYFDELDDTDKFLASSIPSYWPALDEYTNGWLPGQMITVGARTGVGKSVFAINCASMAAAAGKSVLFFSLEMNRKENLDRIFASNTNIELSKYKKNTVDKNDPNVINFRRRLRNWNLRIETTPNVTIEIIRSKAIEMAQSSKGLDFVIIDYLQLITPTGTFFSRQEAVANISRNIKLLAKELNIPIMVLVQLNREKDNEEDNTPKYSDIRESNAIAQDSDVIILIHRKNEEGAENNEPNNKTMFILAKNRNGAADKVINVRTMLNVALFGNLRKGIGKNEEGGNGSGDAPKVNTTEDDYQNYNDSTISDVLGDDLDDDDLDDDDLDADVTDFFDDDLDDDL